MDPAMERELQDRLEAVISATDDEGAPRYSTEDLYVAITYLTIQAGEDFTQLPPGRSRVVARVAEAAGVREDSSPDEVVACMRGFFDRNPPRPELLKQLFGAVRDVNAESSGQGHLSDKLADLVGAQGTAKVLSDAPPPKDSTPAGPMARFALQTAKPASDEKTDSKPTPRGSGKKG